MFKVLLAATVATLALTSPAQAERGERREKAQKGERSEEQARTPQPRVERQRPQARAERPRVEAPQRQAREMRVERPQRQVRQRIERPRLERQRIVREQRFERPQRQAREMRVERPQRQVRQRIERPRIERQRIVREQRLERPQRQARQRIERPRIERQQRQAQRIDRQRIDRQQRQALRVERDQRQAQRLDLRREAGRERFERTLQAREQRFDRLREARAQAGERFERRAERRDEARDRRLSERNQRFFSLARQRVSDQRELPRHLLGEQLDLRSLDRSTSFDAYAFQRYQSFYDPTPDDRYRYAYDYDDGYLYQVDPASGVVAAMFPLLGGAFSVGQPLPIGYESYNVPYAYRGLYYDTSAYQYRYGDGAIYRIDPTTQLITSVVALLTGQTLGIGQMLPAGYDVYNVPYGYRDRFYDTHDAWYRYDDGYIYAVDPRTRTIRDMYPVGYPGYIVGYPMPAYASYAGFGGYPSYGGYGSYGSYPSYAGNGVPYPYQQLYYGAPGYNYHYASGGIYQVDPVSQLVRALVALVTGQAFAVGQVMPTGFDAYNVPYQYRTSYFDTDDAWYRYDDGYIYEVDPHSLVVQGAIPVSYGLQVGQPLPVSYAGYDVPSMYEDLYYDVPGYDYRYSNGGIYQVDPQTRLVQALAGLVTGQNFVVGQALPMGYDVYNVPYSYRDRYYDTGDHLYRYADGHIYRVDPQTRVIEQVIDAIA